MPKKALKAALAFLLLFFNFEAKAKVEVFYGGDENVDACSTIAVVANLNQDKNDFLAVKDSPDIKAKRIDKIYSGQKLWVCAESTGKDWLGVVYSTNENQSCGMSNPLKKRKAYKGPCKSGWVSSKYVQMLAG